MENIIKHNFFFFFVFCCKRAIGWRRENKHNLAYIIYLFSAFGEKREKKNELSGIWHLCVCTPSKWSKMPRNKNDGKTPKRKANADFGVCNSVCIAQTKIHLELCLWHMYFSCSMGCVRVPKASQYLFFYRVSYVHPSNAVKIYKQHSRLERRKTTQYVHVICMCTLSSTN